MPMCFVKGCTSNYRSKKRHFFRPPKGQEQLDKWTAAIPRIDRKLTGKDFVCDLHFKEEFIIKSDVFIINNETVKLPRQKWKLHRDAMPHILPNLQNHSTEEIKSSKPPAKRLFTPAPIVNSEETVHPSLLCAVTDNSDNDCVELPTDKTLKLAAMQHALRESRRRCRQLSREFKKLQKTLSDQKHQLAQISRASKQKFDLNLLSPKEQLVVKTMMRKQKCKSATGMRYDPEYILEAKRFWLKSHKGYIHCATNGLLPLPQPNTLHRLFRKKKCDNGINTASKPSDAVEQVFREKPSKGESGILRSYLMNSSLGRV